MFIVPLAVELLFDIENYLQADWNFLIIAYFWFLNIQATLE